MPTDGGPFDDAIVAPADAVEEPICNLSLVWDPTEWVRTHKYG
jgi:hypothetical protein